MARFYGTKIKDGEMTIEEVHLFWREKVEKWLEENS